MSALIFRIFMVFCRDGMHRTQNCCFAKPDFRYIRWKPEPGKFLFHMQKIVLALLLAPLYCTCCANDKAPEATVSSPQLADVAHPVSDTIRPVPKGGAKQPANGSSSKTGAPAPPPATERATSPAASVPAPAENTNRRLSGFVEVKTLDSSIQLDIRYATANNFTKAKIYDCPRCFLRPDAAKAIAKAQRLLQREGLRLKLFDCYRPRPYQQRLWDKVPNPNYVTPPAKGSMHSRGAAVDLTLVDAQGKELDMGTPYDFFGPQAHSDYTQLSAKVLANRRLLRRTLESVGFQGIRTEWWHFSFKGKTFPLSDAVWNCRE